MESDYERVLLVKSEVFIYRIPPLGTSRGYKAADWKLDSPDFLGRLRLVQKSDKLELKIEDKSSGELFAKCPVDKYPGPAIEAVVDSSRYFVLKIMDDTGRSASIGMGFSDRGDSFDLNVALQDHFKHVEKDEKLSTELATEASRPKLDLGFKTGQTITINLGKKSSSSIGRPKSASGMSQSGAPFCLPPPPPAGSRIAAVAGAVGARSSPSLASSTSSRESPQAFFSESRQSPLPVGQQISSSDNPFISTNPFYSGSGGTGMASQQSSKVENLLDL